jgi:thiamine-monophosphate kinase
LGERPKHNGQSEPRIPTHDSRTVSELGELALIERIKARLPAAPSFVVVGIGDDAAVVEPERNALEVMTTDCQVEGVHFDLAFVSPGDIGHKALAVNLSDLAAMGAAPRVALLSLVLPPALPVAHVDALVDGMLPLAARARIFIVGGNIARSPGPLVVDLTVTGSVHRRRILRRSGARAGDELYVTGALGSAAAGLRISRDGRGRANVAGPDATADTLVVRYLRPEPRLRFGVLLGRNSAASACIDLSDGLADGVRQIASASGVGAIVDGSVIPVAPGATLEDALAGGEDYELLFALSPKLRSRLRHVMRHAGDLPVTKIGRLTRDRVLVLERDGMTEPLVGGYEHFNSFQVPGF